MFKQIVVILQIVKNMNEIENRKFYEKGIEIYFFKEWVNIITLNQEIFNRQNS